ncbi:MAG: Gfo/Idh/MocA family oxidoreductase [Acidimicrobiia bacterium]
MTTTVLVVGVGSVGRRAARTLSETDGIDRVLVADKDAHRAAQVAESLGEVAEAIEWAPADPLPPEVTAVAVAAEAGVERPVVERALERRVPVACSSDDPDGVRSLLDLDDAAREAGVSVAAACGLAPGLSDVLARHAADALEVVTEVHVARAGWAGAACAGALRRSYRGVALEWRDGAWIRERSGSGRQMVWFPQPVGGLDCRRAASGQARLLVAALPRLNRVSMRVARGQADGKRRGRREPDNEGDWGAAWVEVRGRRGRAEEVLVYGVVDRMAFAAGTVLGTAATWLAGLGESQVAQPGVHGLAALVEPVPFLADLAARGVKAAAFEGVR